MDRRAERQAVIYLYNGLTHWIGKESITATWVNIHQ